MAKAICKSAKVPTVAGVALMIGNGTMWEVAGIITECQFVCEGDPGVPTFRLGVKGDLHITVIATAVRKRKPRRAR